MRLGDEGEKIEMIIEKKREIEIKVRSEMEWIYEDKGERIE